MIRALARPAVRITQRRCASTSATTPAVPLQNIETRWATLSAQEQSSVAKHLEQIQAGEWTKMTAEQKKAGTESFKFSLLSLSFYTMQENRWEAKAMDKQNIANMEKEIQTGTLHIQELHVCAPYSGPPESYEEA